MLLFSYGIINLVGRIDMKKYLSILLILLIMVMSLMGVNAKAKSTTTTEAGKKVNFYVFYSETCPICSNLHKYISEILSKDAKYNYMYELVDLEANKSAINKNLMTLVSDKFNIAEKKRNQVPLYVIGEQYFLGFNEETSPDIIVAAIEKAYREKQTDVVASLGSGVVTSTDNEEKDVEMSSDTTGIIILGIVCVVVIAIIYSRSKNRED